MSGKARIALALALAGALFASAQAAPAGSVPGAEAEDPFDAAAFEAEAAAAESSAGAGPASGAASGAAPSRLVGGSALVSAQAYLDPGLEGYAASSYAAGKVFAKVAVPDYGSLFVSWSGRQQFLAGLAGEGPSLGGAAYDLEEPELELSELHYSFDLRKKLFLRLGKQLVAWGPSRVWSPVDFVNAEREDFFAPIDLRAGKAGLRAHLPLGSANAFLFADFSGTVSESGEALDPLKTAALSGRLDAALGGFEFGLSGRASGREAELAGGDFSGYLLGTAVYGELAWAPAEGSVEASLGASRALGELRKWKLSAEGFYNSEGGDLRGDPAAMAAAGSLYMGRFYAYAGLEAEDFPLAGLDSSLSATANLSDRSFYARLAEDFSIPGAPPFSLVLGCYGGEGQGEFTLPFGAGAWSIGLQARMEF